jgi:hypothetical protein
LHLVDLHSHLLAVVDLHERHLQLRVNQFSEAFGRAAVDCELGLGLCGGGRWGWLVSLCTQ